MSDSDAWIGLVKSWWTWPGVDQLKLCYINVNRHVLEILACFTLLQIILLVDHRDISDHVVVFVT